MKISNFLKLTLLSLLFATLTVNAKTDIESIFSSNNGYAGVISGDKNSWNVNVSFNNFNSNDQTFSGTITWWTLKSKVEILGRVVNDELIFKSTKHLIKGRSVIGTTFKLKFINERDMVGSWEHPKFNTTKHKSITLHIPLMEDTPHFLIRRSDKSYAVSSISKSFTNISSDGFESYCSSLNSEGVTWLPVSDLKTFKEILRYNNYEFYNEQLNNFNSINAFMFSDDDKIEGFIQRKSKSKNKVSTSKIVKIKNGKLDSAIKKKKLKGVHPICITNSPNYVTHLIYLKNGNNSSGEFIQNAKMNQQFKVANTPLFTKIKYDKNMFYSVDYSLGKDNITFNDMKTFYTENPDSIKVITDAQAVVIEYNNNREKEFRAKFSNVYDRKIVGEVLCDNKLVNVGEECKSLIFNSGPLKLLDAKLVLLEGNGKVINMAANYEYDPSLINPQMIFDKVKSTRPVARGSCYASGQKCTLTYPNHSTFSLSANPQQKVIRISVESLSGSISPEIWQTIVNKLKPLASLVELTKQKAKKGNQNSDSLSEF